MKTAKHPFSDVWRDPFVQYHQTLAMTATDNLAATARAFPMSLWPRLRQKPKIVDQRFAALRDTECVGIRFFHTGIAVGSFAERPFSGLLEPELAEKILIDRPIDKTADGLVCGSSEPMFPHSDTAIAIGIDMAIRIARNPLTRLEGLGLNQRIAAADFHTDGKFRDRPTGHRSHADFGDQKVAFDQDLVVDKPSMQLGLIERDRRQNRFERQQFGDEPMPWPKALTANPTA